MYQLRKEYAGGLTKRPFVAVHSISMAIQRDECFGLLGPNGMTLLLAHTQINAHHSLLVVAPLRYMTFELSFNIPLSIFLL